ncbi:phage tail protein [Escherichia coli]|uniref:phage tail protein n=14 Tax=Escherichia coli TaxID=562 RepID=UPI001C0BA4C0|nr:tail fiber protein [Escherichia coli]
MGADKTNNIMTLSSGVSQSLLADVQYFELYSSLALNRKLKNIVLPGFYCGFEPVPGTGLSVRITSENSEGKGAASVDVNNVQISVQQIEDVTVSVKAGATNIIVLEANFEHGVKTTQVDSASSVSAARIYARTDNTIGQNQIELCRVIVPSGATAVTKEMIVLKYRVNRAVGVEFSNEISSTEERKAATPKAVKAAYDLANGKYTAQDATTTQKGIVQLSSDTNSTSETLAATPKAVKAAYDLAAGKAPSSHTHPWNQITGVPTASLTAKGITQLSSATNSTSEVLAATPKAVKAAYDLANGKYTAQDATTTQKGIVQLSSDTNSTSETLAATPKAVKAAYDLAAGKAPSSHTHPWNQITGVPTASLTAKGITQLSSATNSTSEVLAATPKAVKAAYDLANGKYTAQDATTTQKGIVQLSSDTNSTSETLAATPKAVKAAYDLAAGKAPSSHTHPWNQITGVPTASLTAKGITQLSSATNSTSEVLAATPKAVKAAYDLANGKYTAQDATTTQKGIVQLSSDTNSTSETLAATPKAVKAAYDLAAGKAPSSHTHPWNQITGVPTASLTAKGITQLSSATNSTSEVLAATPKAVKAAYDLANGKYTAQDATTTQKGIVQLSSDTNSTSETLAATPKAVKAAYDLAAGKAPSSHTHPWNQITGVPTASLTAKGITQLSSATNSTSEVLAATPKAVKAAYDLANGKQPADATLTALAGLATAADRLPYFTGADRAALATLTAIGRAIIAKGSIKDVLNYLGLGEGSALPVGVPVPWPTATPPAGWLKCDGRAFTKEQYPVLARAYPTLRLPDLRGEFIRGWDDGRKVDTGRKLLSAQGATLLRTAMLDYYNQDTTGTSGIVGMGFNNEDSITDLREGSFKMPDGTTFSDPVIVMSDNGMQATILTSIRSGYAKGITVRPRSIALNYIVRAV